MIQSKLCLWISPCHVVCKRRGLGLVAGLLLLTGLPAQEPIELREDTSLPRPVPEWARLVDLGERDPAFKGYRALEGLRVEIVATEPLVVNPMGMRFDEDGSLLVLRWVGGGAEIQPLEVVYRDGTRRNMPR